jgi:hypothetical protein
MARVKHVGKDMSMEILFMTELRDFIDRGTKKAGSLSALGLLLSQSQPNMSHFRAQRKPMPTDACVKLADYIGANLRDVIAANELVSEKKEEKRQFWRSFLDTAKAASIALAIGCGANFVSPSAANAGPASIGDGDTLYYVKSRLQRHRKKTQLARSILEIIQRLKKSFFTFLAPQIAQMQTI